MPLDVEVKDIIKNYGNVEVLKSVSLHVENGEFLTILGPSGSGKTTLLKIISGFEFPTAGEVFIGNKAVTNSPPHKRETGMVFQNYALFPHMTVYGNIKFPLDMRKMNKKVIEEKVDRVLELVELTDFKFRYPNQLSGGQKQRVALARAVVFDPPVLLLDEPLGALDKQLRAKMQLEIKKIQNKLKITTISVTHDQEEALTMSTRICIINDGEIEQIGTPKEIYQQPRTKFIAEFIGETNLIRCELQGWEDDKAIVKSINGELIRVTQLDKEVVEKKDITLAIRPEVISILNDEQKMENCFNGIVQEIVYLGDSINCKLKSERGELIKLKLNSKHNHSLSEGQRLDVGWGANEGILLSS